MNPVFWILLCLLLILLWMLCAFLFKPIGRLVHRIWLDVVNEIVEDKGKEENEQNKSEKE